jgi:transcription elongation factor Elf1
VSTITARNYLLPYRGCILHIDTRKSPEPHRNRVSRVFQCLFSKHHPYSICKSRVHLHRSYQHVPRWTANKLNWVYRTGSRIITMFEVNYIRRRNLLDCSNCFQKLLYFYLPSSRQRWHLSHNNHTSHSDIHIHFSSVRPGESVGMSSCIVCGYSLSKHVHRQQNVPK